MNAALVKNQLHKFTNAKIQSLDFAKQFSVDLVELVTDHPMSNHSTRMHSRMSRITVSGTSIKKRSRFVTKANTSEASGVRRNFWRFELVFGSQKSEEWRRDRTEVVVVEQRSQICQLEDTRDKSDGRSVDTWVA